MGQNSLTPQGKQNSLTPQGEQNSLTPKGNSQANNFYAVMAAKRFYDLGSPKTNPESGQSDIWNRNILVQLQHADHWAMLLPRSN